MSEWHTLDNGFEQDFPEEGRLLEVTTNKGSIMHCRFSSNLFWIPSMEMYVYYTPVMWRYLPEED